MTEPTPNPNQNEPEQPGGPRRPKLKVRVVRKPTAWAVLTPVVLYFVAWTFGIQIAGIGFPADVLLLLLSVSLPAIIIACGIVNMVWIRRFKIGSTRMVPTIRALRQFALVLATFEIAIVFFGLRPMLLTMIETAESSLDEMYAADTNIDDRTQFNGDFVRVYTDTVNRLFETDLAMSQFEQIRFTERFRAFAIAVSDNVISDVELRDLRTVFARGSTASSALIPTAENLAKQAESEKQSPSSLPSPLDTTLEVPPE